MDNPFLKRATEHVRDDEAFLSLVSPEPVRHYLAPSAEAGVLFDRLVVIRGTPGSGKTTLARLFELPTVAAVLRNSSFEGYKPLVASLTQCRAVAEDRPLVVGARLSLESDYREIWEFPYSEELRLALTLALIQARAVLAWARHLENAGFDVGESRLVHVAGAEGAAAAIGGTALPQVTERARVVERALYEVAAALVPPPLDRLPAACTGAYQPFDVLEAVLARRGVLETRLLPLVILDDAHVLHPMQYRGLRLRLARRELRIARWIMTRLDVLNPAEALEAFTETQQDHPPLPGVSAKRDVTAITLQSVPGPDGRRRQRSAFRAMAKDMADRYLRRMPLFAARRLQRLSDLLSTEEAPFPEGGLKRLEQVTVATQEHIGLPEARRAALLASVETYLGSQAAPEYRLTMLDVMMHRYGKRTSQRGLFGEESPEPAKPLTADISVYDAAKLRLFHDFQRPYYFGMDDLCDAGSENAEQFLHLAAELVEAAAGNVIRGSKTIALDPALQHRLLTTRAGEILQQEWDFPHCDGVKKLVTAIARRCVDKSLERNAPLGAGANAYGIRQEEFEKIPTEQPRLAQVLQFGVAYNGFTLVPHYHCKDDVWCLLELGGIPVLHFGLTLKRGGFLEGSARELDRLLQEPA